MNSDLERIANQLDGLSEQIDELAFDRLSEATAAGLVDRPQSDKRLMQARRSLDKAAHLLRSITD
ncbi:MAG: hypothetical protein AB8G14_01940 [Ilumatobacter sp.]